MATMKNLYLSFSVMVITNEETELGKYNFMETILYTF